MNWVGGMVGLGLPFCVEIHSTLGQFWVNFIMGNSDYNAAISKGFAGSNTRKISL